MTRPWWDGAVIYQIYPRAFADADRDGIGDLAGITAHLGHLAGQPGSLGADAIWISPIYPHGGVDGGYDVTDHTAVAAEFGTLAEFDRLVSTAHKAGLRVLLDLVSGHVSDRHPWFEAARSSRTDPHRDWFLWADPRPGGRPPTNWVAAFGGSAWTVDPVSGQSYHHSFFSEQPDLNWRNPVVRSAIAEVMRFWFDRGVDGFRVDALEFLLKDERLRDNPPAGPPRPPWSDEPGGLQRRWTRNQRGVTAILRGMRRVAGAYPDRVLLGELYAAPNVLARALGGRRHDAMHLVFDHQLAKSPWDAAAFRRAIAAAERHLAPPLAPTWALSNHDLPRHATRWGPDRARLAALILLTLRGAVCLYQGEEIGMTDADLPPSARLDPFGRDPARQPIDWAAVARQRRDPTSLLSLYRGLIALRHRTPALCAGSLRILTGLPSGVLGYDRGAGRQRVSVFANMGSGPARIRRLGRRSVLAATDVDQPAATGDVLTIGPNQGIVVR